MFHARTVLAFTVVAMTSLLPYNLFMNAHEYFYYKLRNVTDMRGMEEEDLLRTVSGAYYRNKSNLGGTEPTTELQRTYEGWFTVTSGVACILGSLLNTVATNKLSNGFRVLTGHAIVLLSLMPTLLYTFIDTDEDQPHFFWLSMFFSSISSFGSMGLIGAGITGLAATFPESYMQMVMIGQAVAGICTSLLSIICQAATANAILNGRIYFGLAFIWTLFSVLCYFCLVRSSYAKEIIERADDHDRLLEEDEEGEEVDYVERDDDQAVISLTPMDSSPLFDGWGEILEQSRPDMACAMFILIVTLAAFPAVSSLVRTETTNETWKAYFSSICCFLLFNCCDAMGRVFASRVSISRSQLQKFSLARLLLLPLIIVCDVQPRFHSPTLIRNDAIFILLNMTLALSHGFCFTHAYVMGVKSVEPALRETAGSMMSLACVAAALMGSMIGVGIVAIV